MLIKLIAPIALACTLASPLAAATLTFTATSNNPSQIGDFSIIFDDQDGDMRIDDGEVVSFSGFTTTFPINRTYTDLLRISPIPAETDVATTFTSGGFPLNTWLFGVGTDRTTAQPASFTYSVSAVPLPASSLMLLVGLVGFGYLRNRRT